LQVVAADRQVQADVQSAWNTYVAAKAAISSNQAQVDADQIAYEGVKKEQEVGARTILDVLNAQQEFRAAQLSLINARANEYTAAASLLNAMGLLDVGVFAPNAPRYNPKDHFDKVNDFELPWEPVIKSIDQILAPKAPERKAGANEVVPKFGTP
jgi:outer membrane protein